LWTDDQCNVRDQAQKLRKVDSLKVGEVHFNYLGLFLKVDIST
jgi:hypothetical protein